MSDSTVQANLDENSKNVGAPRASVRFVDVGDNEDGQRLDNFLLKELKGVPKSRIYRIVRKGEVRINKKRCKPNDRLKLGDRVRIPPVHMGAAANPASPSRNLRDLLMKSVLFEDEALLVIDKPSGLAVHGGSGLSLGLIESLRAMRPEHDYLELVHRLDRGTSGCIILARSRKALLAMHDIMRGRDIKKEYLALVSGAWPAKVKTVDAPLKKNQTSAGERFVRVDQEGKQAKTHFLVERKFEKATLVRAKLETGRTHQIRVHAKLVGNALAGDDKYGDPSQSDYFKRVGLKRLFLHAAYLEFCHPLSGDVLRIESTLPQELHSVLENLES